ncbi:hypothetical protein [Nesterenkonia sp. CF4.4]|uniref:hypothetical protein n=1 Tax=Nesterenkonia sp. CF4.4 TaxID=3373079 RepID=UPI003EE6F3EF
MKLTSTRVLWDMVDGPMPRGLLGVGIGDLHADDEQWTLFLGGFSTTFRTGSTRPGRRGAQTRRLRDGPSTATPGAARRR